MIVGSGGALKVSPWWLVISYFFQTVGELCDQPGRPVVDDEAVAAQVRRSDDGRLVPRHGGGQPHRGSGGRQRESREPGRHAEVVHATTTSLVVAAVVLALLIVPVRNMMARQTDASGAL